MTYCCENNCLNLNFTYYKKSKHSQPSKDSVEIRWKCIIVVGFYDIRKHGANMFYTHYLTWSLLLMFDVVSQIAVNWTVCCSYLLKLTPKKYKKTALLALCGGKPQVISGSLFPLTKGQQCRRCFHIVNSSCSVILCYVGNDRWTIKCGCQFMQMEYCQWIPYCRSLVRDSMAV